MPPFIRPFDSSMDGGQVLPTFRYQIFQAHLGKRVYGAKTERSEAEKPAGEVLEEESGDVIEEVEASSTGNEDDITNANGRKGAATTSGSGSILDMVHDEEVSGSQNSTTSDNGSSVSSLPATKEEGEIQRWTSRENEANEGSVNQDGFVNEDVRDEAKTDSEATISYTWRYEEYMKRLESQRQQEKQRRKVQAREMWTTPGLRPLVEPLVLDWDWFFREKIPSDAQYKALFPEDPEKRARIKDVVGELEAITEYTGWALMMKDDPDDPDMPGDIRDEARRQFYSDLHQELNKDKDEVEMEFRELYGSASSLAQWEFKWLDDDGVGTTRLEEFVEKGADIFTGWGPEVAEKYGHLLPPGHEPNQLATFEWQYLDSDGGVTRMKGMLKEGNDFFWVWCGSEIVQKYGHLRAILPRWARWSADNVKRYGWRRWFEDPAIAEDVDGRLLVVSRPSSRSRYWASRRDWYIRPGVVSQNP